eukprot:scaffold38719_cov62-Phaeocystis_antarctica.AAC.3
MHLSSSSSAAIAPWRSPRVRPRISVPSSLASAAGSCRLGFARGGGAAALDSRDRPLAACSHGASSHSPSSCSMLFARAFFSLGIRLRAGTPLVQSVKTSLAGSEGGELIKERRAKERLRSVVGAPPGSPERCLGPLSPFGTAQGRHTQRADKSTESSAKSS